MVKVIAKFACYDKVHGQIAKTMTTYRIVETTDSYSHVCYRIQSYLQNLKKWTNEYIDVVHWSTLDGLYNSREFKILFGEL